MDAKLSPHFRLAELLVTDRAEVRNTPTMEDLDRLRVLCADGLEVIRAHYGKPVTIHSGYRSRELNAVIPGSAHDSAHCYGCAADFHVEGVRIADVVRWIATESGIPFDQVIDEAKGAGRWVHLGLLRPGHELRPRHQVLWMRDGDYSQFPLEVSP
jgi:zinc D-Ala-D-Ala carboxypeptidase